MNTTCMFIKRVLEEWDVLIPRESMNNGRTHAGETGMCIHSLAGKKHKTILLQPITGVAQPDGG